MVMMMVTAEMITVSMTAEAYYVCIMRPALFSVIHADYTT